MSDFNKQIIDEFRANGGTVTTAGFGNRLILVHTVGVKSGEPRINPLLGLPDGDSWLVVGSAGGSPKTPAWVHNLRAADQFIVEAPRDGTVAEFTARATELTPDEWGAAWGSFVAASPAFAKYTETSQGRHFPIFRITPVQV